jgi:hypothetical protein
MTEHQTLPVALSAHGVVRIPPLVTTELEHEVVGSEILAPSRCQPLAARWRYTEWGRLELSWTVISRVAA